MKKENTAIRLKKIMSNRNLRQVDILNMTKPYCMKYGVKMNKSDISQYCSGKSEPNQDKLFVLGAALDVSEAWLMGYDVPMERTLSSKLNNEITCLIYDIDHIDENIAFRRKYKEILHVLGYKYFDNWKEDENGEQIDLIENQDFQIEVPNKVFRDKEIEAKAFIKFQLNDLFDEYTNIPRNKLFDAMTDEEFDRYLDGNMSDKELEEISNRNLLNAAHARTDIDIPEGVDTSEDNIMDDENF